VKVLTDKITRDGNKLRVPVIGESTAELRSLAAKRAAVEAAAQCGHGQLGINDESGPYSVDEYGEELGAPSTKAAYFRNDFLLMGFGGF
jgi:hypothetical protein